MNRHATTWLEMYFDGELEGRQLSSAEEHLSNCAGCQEELKALSGLSELLQSSPGPESLLSSNQFLNQVGLRLPRLPEQPLSQKILSLGWRITPLGIIGMWSFFQTVFLVTGILFLAVNLGFGGDTLASLAPSSQPGPGIGDLFSLHGANLDEIIQTTLAFLRTGGPFGWTLIINLVMSFVLGLLFCSWLASWWVRAQATSKSAMPLYINKNGY